MNFEYKNTFTIYTHCGKKIENSNIVLKKMADTFIALEEFGKYMWLGDGVGMSDLTRKAMIKPLAAFETQITSYNYNIAKGPLYVEREMVIPYDFPCFTIAITEVGLANSDSDSSSIVNHCFISLENGNYNSACTPTYGVEKIISRIYVKIADDKSFEFAPRDDNALVKAMLGVKGLAQAVPSFAVYDIEKMPQGDTYFTAPSREFSASLSADALQNSLTIRTEAEFLPTDIVGCFSLKIDGDDVLYMSNPTTMAVEGVVNADNKYTKIRLNGYKSKGDFTKDGMDLPLYAATTIYPDKLIAATQGEFNGEIDASTEVICGAFDDSLVVLKNKKEISVFSGRDSFKKLNADIINKDFDIIKSVRVVRDDCIIVILDKAPFTKFYIVKNKKLVMLSSTFKLQLEDVYFMGKMNLLYCIIKDSAKNYKLATYYYKIGETSIVMAEADEIDLAEKFDIVVSSENGRYIYRNVDTNETKLGFYFERQPLSDIAKQRFLENSAKIFAGNYLIVPKAFAPFYEFVNVNTGMTVLPPDNIDGKSVIRTFISPTGRFVFLKSIDNRYRHYYFDESDMEQPFKELDISALKEGNINSVNWAYNCLNCNYVGDWNISLFYNRSNLLIEKSGITDYDRFTGEILYTYQKAGFEFLSKRQLVLTIFAKGGSEV